MISVLSFGYLYWSSIFHNPDLKWNIVKQCIYYVCDRRTHARDAFVQCYLSMVGNFLFGQTCKYCWFNGVFLLLLKLDSIWNSCSVCVYVSMCFISLIVLYFSNPSLLISYVFVTASDIHPVPHDLFKVFRL